ncbi:uncharacterized protein LOC114323364 [Camellia sinensis]|uniref:uncharacterized protein LOC114323364 n=1 Tax=Camellia sinensis TaxID=4442 RepID=UPI0010359E44|nr:uncharacterized protein LOC114323364 [Camellia sinensis]
MGTDTDPMIKSIGVSSFRGHSSRVVREISDLKVISSLKKLGHVIKDCPRRQQARQGQAAPARAFVVMPRTDKVQNTFNLFQEPITVLFDTGASHSFISRRRAVTLYEMCKDFEIDFAGRVLYADLIVLGFEGFTIILDMDWLRNYFATLDCARKIVNIDIPGMSRLTHTSSDREESVMTSFLCSVEIPKQDISEVDVVHEFKDVFQEIPGPPP